MLMNGDAPGARDKPFWTQMRRGLLMVVRAIDAPASDHADPDEQRFWAQIQDGLSTAVEAIERRYDIQAAERPRTGPSPMGRRA